MFEFTIYSKLPTLNEYINSERTNKYLAASMKRKFTDLCALEIKSQIKEKDDFPITNTVDLDIMWTVNNNRQDPDNIYFGVKFVLDGLVQAGVIKNDNRKYVSGINNKIKTGEKYSVVVKLT